MKLRFLLSEEGEVGGRKAVVQDVRSSTKMKIKRGYGVRRKNEELRGAEGNQTLSLFFTKLLPGHHICPRQRFLGLTSHLPSILCQLKSQKKSMNTRW